MKLNLTLFILTTILLSSYQNKNIKSKFNTHIKNDFEEELERLIDKETEIELASKKTEDAMIDSNYKNTNDNEDIITSQIEYDYIQNNVDERYDIIKSINTNTLGVNQRTFELNVPLIILLTIIIIGLLVSALLLGISFFFNA